MVSPSNKLGRSAGVTIACVLALALLVDPPARSETQWQKQQRAKFNNSAPADRYFGRMKLSYLGINQAFKNAAISAGDHTTDAGVINSLTFPEESLLEWSKAFPKDPELARSYFLATLAYRKIWTEADQDKAWSYMNLIVQRFPDSYFGKQVRKDLDVGFTRNFYYDPVPCPEFATESPEPTPTPTPPPKNMPKTQLHVPYCYTPSPSPSPSATPLPSEQPILVPTPTPANAVPSVAPSVTPSSMPSTIIPSPGASR